MNGMHNNARVKAPNILEMIFTAKKGEAAVLSPYCSFRRSAKSLPPKKAVTDEGKQAKAYMDRDMTKNFCHFSIKLPLYNVRMRRFSNFALENVVIRTMLRRNK